MQTSRRRLATFVHISDLHFGELDAQDDAQVESAVPWWWRLLPLCKGYLGHHGVALRQLDDLIGLLHEEEQAVVLVTGDLSANGGERQVNLSMNYLRSTIALTTNVRTGLNDVEILSRTIPGNHDHWPGFSVLSPVNPLPMLGPSTYAFSNLFWERPKAPYPYPLVSGHRVTFLGIDTDADVQGISFERLFAQGSFESQLKDLRSQLGGIDRLAGEVRVLLLHHSLIEASCIDDTSRKELAETLQDCRISVILTGHTHDPIVATHQLSSGWSVFEARCGTSTQRDFYPPEWQKVPLPDMPELEANSVLVHRIYQVARNTVQWRTTPYVRSDQGFTVADPSAPGHGQMTITA
jgi:DNA repair exonuclease SbcCD nuclease subunit